MALFLQRFLCSLPRLPRPTAVNTPQAHEEQLLFPGRVQKWAPRSASLAGPESQPGGWGREWEESVGTEGGGNKPRPSLLRPVCKIPAPEALLPLRGVTRALWTVESSPHRRGFPCERCLALLTTAPNPCQQHFKLWPAQCYILTGQALLA